MARKYKIEVKGVSALLYNRFIDAEIDTKSKKRTGGAKEQNVENKLYLTPEGKPYIPSVYFRNSLIEAGKSFKVVGRGKSNYSKLAGATIDVCPDAILNDNKWVPFRISAVNPMTKGRMMVTRPMMEKWGCTFEIVLNDDSIDGSTLKEMLDHAGRYVGIGDWRPAKKGQYGKFMVTSFKEAD